MVFFYKDHESGQIKLKERNYIMAIINCPECNTEISDKASSCPNCGYPIRNEQQTTEGTIKQKPITPKKFKSKLTKPFVVTKTMEMLCFAISIILCFTVNSYICDKITTYYTVYQNSYTAIYHTYERNKEIIHSIGKNVFSLADDIFVLFSFIILLLVAIYLLSNLYSIIRNKPTFVPFITSLLYSLIFYIVLNNNVIGRELDKGTTSYTGEDTYYVITSLTPTSKIIFILAIITTILSLITFIIKIKIKKEFKAQQLAVYTQ